MTAEISLTREQLYEKVWDEPMTKVAALLGLSDVGLAKICGQADIPVPSRGYWAKKRSGQRVARRRLSPSDEQIEFVFRPQPKPGVPKPVEPDYPPEVVELIDAAKKLPKIAPRGELVDLHQLVERTRVALGHCKLDDRPTHRSACFLKPEPVKGRPVLHLQVGKNSVTRALLILDALLRAVEAIGGKFIENKGPDADIRLTLLGQDIGGFRLFENQRQAKNPKFKDDSWFEARVILVPGGELTFASSTQHVTNSARDTPKHKLEESLNKLVVGWAEMVGREPIERRLAEERAARRAAEEKRRQEEAARRERLRTEFLNEQRIERERIEELKQQAARWHESEQIRAYVQAVRLAGKSRSACEAPIEKMPDWITWASKQADRLDPLTASMPSVLDLTFDQYLAQRNHEPVTEPAAPANDVSAPVMR